MNHVFERPTVAPRLEMPDVLSRLAAGDRQHAFNRLEDAGHPSKRQRRGDESYDLPVVASWESPDDLNGVGGRIRIVEFGVQAIQGRFQRADIPPATPPELAIRSPQSVFHNPQSVVHNPQSALVMILPCCGS